MNIQLITIIPAAAAMIWAIVLMIRQKRLTDAFLLTLSAICVLANAILVYRMIVTEIGTGMHMIQMASCSFIIPLFYMFSTRQVGGTSNKIMTVLLWMLAAMSFIPQIVVYNPFEPFIYPEAGFKPFAFYIISKGQKVFAIYNGDLMVSIQALLTSFSFIPFTIKLHRHNLHLNPKIFLFVLWWIFTIMATIMLSGMTYADLRSQLGEWVYFITYSILIISINILIILRFDRHLLQTQVGDSVNNLNVYVQQQYVSMAEKMKKIVEEEELYLNPDCTSEGMVERLATNRTYFTHMMSSEFGMTFSEYVNSLRMAHVEELLRTTRFSLSDIAEQSGYSDAGYMGRKFKELHGVSPSEWRKEYHP